MEAEYDPASLPYVTVDGVTYRTVIYRAETTQQKTCPGTKTRPSKPQTGRTG